MNEASVMWARAIRREHRVATVLLGLLVGVAGAIAMTGWEVARRTDAAVPAFVEASGAPAATVFTCPEGYFPPDAGGDDFFDRCMRNMSLDFADPLADLDEVAAVAPAAFVVGEVDLGDGRPQMIGFDVGFDPEARFPGGDGMVIHGRALDQSAHGELVWDEHLWKTRPPGIELGTTLMFTPYLASQPECASGAPCEPAGEPVTLTVVGVKRMPSDLASNTEGDGGLSVSAGFWSTQVDQDVFTYGIGYNVWLADGAGVDDLERAIASEIPDRFAYVDGAANARVDSLSEAIAYQSGAARVFAAISAFAGLVFAGQALARQTRRETADVKLLNALGMTRRELTSAVALRAVPVALLGGGLATVFAVLASPVGPVGIARGTIASATISIDALVLVVGSIAVTVCALCCSTLPMVRDRRVAPVVRPEPSARLRLGGTRLPAPVLAGVRAAFRRGGDTALPVVLGVAGTAIAVASIIAASTLVASLDAVTADPARYGVAWDVLVGNNGSPEDEAASFEALTGIDGVEAASGVMTTNVAADGVETPLMALVPVPGFDPVEPVILEGRAPFQPNEAALGPVTMRELGVGVGEVVTFEMAEFPGPPLDVTIVGTAALNDGFDVELGHGVLVDGTWANETAPGAFAQAIAVRLDPTREAAALDTLGEVFGQFVETPQPSATVRHLVRVDDLPLLLSAVVVLLAIASLGHMMWVSVRQRRFEFGVLRAIGFRRSQVWWSIATHAAVVAAVAVVIGIPAGVIGGGWGWRAVARAIGVSMGPTFVATSIVVGAAGALVAALVAAAIPGWRAVRLRPGVALRTE